MKFANVPFAYPYDATDAREDPEAVAGHRAARLPRLTMTPRKGG